MSGLVSSSSYHSIPASIPTPCSLMSRGRVDVAALVPRAQATEMTSHSHQPTTVTKIETCGLSEHQLDSSPEPLIVPLRVRLTRLSDPVPLLQRRTRVPCFKLQVRVKTDHLLHIHSCRQPQYPRLRHLLHRTQSGTDYHKNNLMSTHLHFLSHHWQEIKWDRVSSFLSIPVAIEKVIAFGTLRLKCTFNHRERPIISVHTLL